MRYTDGSFSALRASCTLVGLWFVGCLVAGCSSSSSTAPSDESLVWAEVLDETTDEARTCDQAACESDTDCPLPGPCVLEAGCVQGCCVYSLAEEGAACEETCLVDGTCSAAGLCEGLTTRVCDEVDGNICTAAECDYETGACVEKPVPDGASPFESDCWSTVTCKAGAVDIEDSTPSALQIQCNELSEGLLATAPYGCIERYECVDGNDTCQVIPRDEQPCWPAGSGASSSTCVGYKCFGTECKVDHALDHECGTDDYPAGCGESCRACTELSCHWIPDELNPRRKHGYCQPQALPYESCDDGDACTVGDTCVLAGAPHTGPTGEKETVGDCQAGPHRDCPDYLCAQGICSEETGECEYADPDHAYCRSVSTCLSSSELNKCKPTATTNPNFDPETGCVLNDWLAAGASCDIDEPCVEEAQCFERPDKPGWTYCKGVGTKTCDDFNPCTDDQCTKDDAGNVTCVFPWDDTNACDDGNACTDGDQCSQGACVAGVAVDCPDDGDACTVDSCDPGTGDCIALPVDCDDDNPCTEDSCDSNVGACTWVSKDCDDDNACTVDSCDPETGACQVEPEDDNKPCALDDAGCVTWACVSGVCQPAEGQISNGSPDLCNELDDDCDGTTDENCYMEYRLVGHAWTAGHVDSGDGQSAVSLTAGNPKATSIGPISDGTFTIVPAAPPAAK